MRPTARDGRKAELASARPTPAWPSGSNAERAPGRGHRAPRARGGVVGASSPTASSGQDLCVEHRCGEWKMPGKDGAGGAHRGSRSPVRQFGGGGAMVFQRRRQLR
jgi:hypothetical protein